MNHNVNKVISKSFKKQITDTFNRPILSICEENPGLAYYYIKYARTEMEYEGLFAELLCSRLANVLNIQTPNVAFVEIGDHPITNVEYKYPNKIEPGMVAFGSRRVGNVTELNQQDVIRNKHDFNRFNRPEDIFKIALFDLWIANADRSELNFNILIQKDRPKEIYAFDHFEAFKKSSESQNSNEKIDVFSGVMGSNYGYNLISYLSVETVKETARKFLNNIEHLNIANVLGNLLNQIPESWNVPQKSVHFIHKLLTDRTRVVKISEQADIAINSVSIKKP